MNSSTGATISLDCNPQKKPDPQTEAAKAAAKRREQNRIAQQKHSKQMHNPLFRHFTYSEAGSKAREQNGNNRNNRERKSASPTQEQAPPTPADTVQDLQAPQMMDEIMSEVGVEDSWTAHHGSLSIDMSNLSNYNFSGIVNH